MIDEGLLRLIAANAPYWAAEAEIVRSYWTSEIRTRETDLLWLLRQCYKEYWDGFIPPFNRLTKEINDIDNGAPRDKVLVHAETLAEEFAHYCAFANVYEALRINDQPHVSPALLKIAGDWDENIELVHLRKEHKKTHGDLGRRAHFFTEGGYCTLYAEGAALKGQGGIEDMIAVACERVYDDEFGHMLFGIAGLAEEGLHTQDWDQLIEMTVAQMQKRLHMRNAQFSFPIESTRLQEMLAGQCEPLAFDWERAGFEPPANVVDLRGSALASASR